MKNKRLIDLKQVIEHLKDRISIVDVINEVTETEKAGADLYKALCCFHNEKTPSLTMTPSKGLYHCFGCKESGDIISFYKKTQNISTVEAIYKLAEDYGIDISAFERDLTEEEKRLVELQKICSKVQIAMTAKLLETDSKGYQRMVDRDIDDETMAEFGIGYVERETDILGLMSDQDADLLEFTKPSMYTDAIIYPLFDPYGQIVGFKTRPYWNGRLVDNQGRKLAKFLGTSSKFPLFTEEHIYGFHIARKHLKEGRLILVEGQHDVLSLHQAGIKNVAGTDGTSLNEEKLKLLKEFGIREVIIAYDGDNAGMEASTRVAEQVISNSEGISVKIAKLTDNLDPDEMIRQGKKIEFLECIENATYGSQYLIDSLYDKLKPNSITGKLDYMKQLQPILAKVPKYELAFIVPYIAEKLGVHMSVVEDMIRHEQAKQSNVLLYNIDAEMIVLGEMIRNQDFRLEAMTEIKPKDFYLNKNMVVYELIAELEEQQMKVEIETLKMMMNNKGYKHLLSDGDYFEDIMLSFGESKPMKEDVIDKSMRRALMEEAEKLKSNAQDLKQRTVLVVESHLENVEKITSVNNENLLTAQKGATDFMDKLHERMGKPNEITGMTLNDRFPNLTGLINGVQNKKLITISANQSVGKTTLLCNWLDEIAVTNKKPWVHFSLEMTSEEIVQKIIGIRAGVNTQQLEKGNITNEEYERVKQATIDYHEGGLILIDDQTTMEGIMNTCRKLIRTHNIAGISIDYIQLMSVERNRNKQRYEELGDISGALKNDVAKKLDKPVIILSQLGRSAIEANVAKAEHGAGSYKIAQDSDIYITLKEKSIEEIEKDGIENGNLILNLDKNRGGRADVLMDVYFQRDIQRMMEVNK